MSIGYPDYPDIATIDRDVGAEIITVIPARLSQTKLLGMNLNRARGLIINNASKDLYIWFGREPFPSMTSTEPYTRISANGGTMFIYNDFVESIYGIWNGFGTIALSGNAIIHELSYLN
jgi:hypothetical protein